MQKRFDLRKLTLTDFKPGEYQQATSKLITEQKQQKGTVVTPSDAPVPEGRTTLRLGKLRGVVSPQAQPQYRQSDSLPVPENIPSHQPAESAEPPTGHITETIQPPDASISQSVESHPNVVSEVPPLPEGQDIISPEPLSAQSRVEEISIVPPGEQSILYGDSPSQTQSERAAALHVKATRAKKPKPDTITPESLVAFNTRQPKWLKDSFFNACNGKGATPSIIIRNLMKSYCGLCLIIAFATLSFSKDIKDSTCTTDHLLSYFYSRTFGAKSLVPDLKTSVGVRHALWQTGAQDSTDYIYSDRSNTRLEARVEIPILDFAYLKDRSKDKDELRAFVMKSLSKILAAQKSVNILESRLNALKSRLEYLRNQITLKLVNKSDLFPVEDQFYNVQSQLYEAQSTLEQRIIDLAVIAGNDWLDAYRLIVKWDGKLFDQVN